MGRNVTRPRPLAAPRPLLESCDPSQFLIYTPKIRNRRNLRQITNLHFSNRGSDKASASRANNVSRGTSLAFLIYTPKIRNRRNPSRITNLHFSNRGSDKASASRANNVSRGTSLAFLIYTPKIRNRRNPSRITNLHFSNLYKPATFSLYRSGGSFLSLRALSVSAVDSAVSFLASRVLSNRQNGELEKSYTPENKGHKNF